MLTGDSLEGDDGEAEELREGPDRVVHLHHLDDHGVGVGGSVAEVRLEAPDPPDEAVGEWRSSDGLVEEDALEAEPGTCTTGNHLVEGDEPHVLERCLKQGGRGGWRAGQQGA